MTVDTFLALITFAFVTSVTPGPNNFMLLASGVNFGFVRTFPHMCGIAAGFCTLLLGVGFGLGALLKSWPTLALGLKFAGGAYLLYLAWKIAGSRSLGESRKAARPITFLQAAAFQWVNPKAWMMGVTAMVLFTDPSRPDLSVVFVALAFVLVNFPSVSVWAGFGMVLRRFLSDPARLKWFNIVMAVLLVATLIPMMM
ncbi:LysE family translocator [Hoeflea prorocentri]|uniref:LysE family translocator n=1 Tax=Hoeflea prorocentri TaxID=1922333 RepID=A0A9X3ZGN3_9HYPH|nr:LysE family translocator [Hoeflea prorocentri]MCY6379981.1 LysE family translocator [Hoeflea prorocentri]MDA5397781.1 LysE family translocator [Hoeflea prorocentri]